MVLRTFISRGAVEWTPGGVCVFDGLEWVKERCIEWLGERMSEKRAGELLRDDERGKADELQEEGKPSARAGREPPAIPAEMPAGITLVEAEPIVDRKSVFIGRACRITDPSQVRSHLGVLLVHPLTSVVGSAHSRASPVGPAYSTRRSSYYKRLAMSGRRNATSR